MNILTGFIRTRRRSESRSQQQHKLLHGTKSQSCLLAQKAQTDIDKDNSHVFCERNKKKIKPPLKFSSVNPPLHLYRLRLLTRVSVQPWPYYCRTHIIIRWLAWLLSSAVSLLPFPPLSPYSTTSATDIKTEFKQKWNATKCVVLHLLHHCFFCCCCSREIFFFAKLVCGV